MRSARVRAAAGTPVGALILALTWAGPLEAQAPAERAPVAYAIVIASTLNVRAEPGLNADVIGSVARGDTVCVFRTEGDWTEIRERTSEPDDQPSVRGFASRGFLSERRAAPERLAALGC